MPFLTIFGRAMQKLARPSLLWLYGPVAALLGWTTLGSAFIAAVVRGDNPPVGGGTPGLLWLALSVLIALGIEIAAIRALAPRRNDDGLLLLAALRRIPRAVSFAIALGVLTLIVAVTVVFSLTWIFSTALGVIVDFLTLDLAGVAALALMSLALVLPVWVFAPLGLRAAVLDDNGAWEACFASMALFEERTGQALAALLLCAALDGGLYALGVALGARDMSALSVLGVLSGWTGASVPGGLIVLALAIPLGMFKLALWNAVYADSAQAVGGIAERPSADSAGARRWLTVTALSAGHAVQALRRAPALLLLALVVAFIGALGPADIVTMYHLVPARDQTANQIALDALLPGNGNSLLLVCFPVAWFISLWATAGLALAARDALRGQPVRLGAALQTAFERTLHLLTAKLALLVIVGMVTGIVVVGVLFAFGLLVQVAPGMDAVSDRVMWALIALGVIGGLMLNPLVARAALFDGLRGSDAVYHAFDVLTARPTLALLLFALTFALDVGKGPLASLAGLLTNGWSLALGVLAVRTIGLGPLAASVALFAAAVIIAGFKAVLWTQFYDHAALAAENAPAVSDESAAEAPAMAAVSRSPRTPSSRRAPSGRR